MAIGVSWTWRKTRNLVIGEGLGMLVLEVIVGRSQKADKIEMERSVAFTDERLLHV